MVEFLIGMAVGVGIAYLAYRARALNREGGIAAGVLGTVVFGLGGLAWALVMLTFFISSSGLSKFFNANKASADAEFAKGSQRDAWQVAANGGVGGILALTYFILVRLFPASGWLPFLWIGFAASLAGANADTWGTELGALNPRKPVLLTNFRRVPPGTSGAVSLVGSLAALAGSALVAGVAVLAGRAGWAPELGLRVWLVFVIITTGGFLGALVDSLLGATLQAIYYCPVCDKHTEKHPTHTCGAQTVRARGLPWLNNDWVNLACTLSAGLAGVLLVLIFL
ncbi:MAG: DUF92 domain-containing protein [Brevefilum sp.]|nr:DUF92 domain-containing protein [Brevefilum sp.]